MKKEFKVVVVDYKNSKQREDLVDMLIAYSADLMGGGEPLDRALATKSIELIASKPYTMSFLCYDEDSAVGFANCFETVATFAAKTAINIHDLAVIDSHRGLGISTQILNTISAYGKANDCYKITLEVLEGNIPARKSYEKSGFKPYQLNPTMGSALFFQKLL